MKKSIQNTAYIQNGYFGFPLDDSWIHLQFAKNLNEYGSFSYYKTAKLELDRIVMPKNNQSDNGKKN